MDRAGCPAPAEDRPRGTARRLQRRSGAHRPPPPPHRRAASARTAAAAAGIAGPALAIMAVLASICGASAGGLCTAPAHAASEVPTVHESVLHLAWYPPVGGTAELTFNVTYSAAVGGAAAGPPPVRLDVTGSEYPHLYRVHNITSNVGAADPSVLAPYDHAAEATRAVDGTTYTVRAVLEVLSAGVIPVYARGLDGDIVTVHVAASDLLSMPYESYLLTGQTYLDAVYGKGAAAAGSAQAAPPPPPPPSFPPPASVRVDHASSRAPGIAPPVVASPVSVPRHGAMAVPASAAPQAAPDAAAGASFAAQSAAPPPPRFDVFGYVSAEGYAAGERIPARNIQVCVHHHYPPNMTFHRLSTAGGGNACAFTDGNGTYRVSGIVNDDPFDLSAADPIPVLYSRGPDGLVVAGSDFLVYTNYTFWYSDAPGDIEHDFELPPAQSGAARAINAMSDARDFFDAYGLPRENLTVLWQHDAGASAFPPGTNGAKSWRTFIWLDGDAPPTSDDTLYPYTMLHEFGHYAAYVGGVLNSYTCPSHYIRYTNTPGCAWGEGWANFVPHMVYDSPKMLRTSWLEYNAETASATYAGTDIVRFTFDMFEPPSRYVGDRVEGRVAAALWDMADRAVDPVHDTAGPGRPLAYDGLGAGYGPIVETVLGSRFDSMAEFYGAWEEEHYEDTAEAVMRLHGMSFAIPNTVRYYGHAGSFGGNGSGPSQMLYPLDVDVAPNGTVLVADTANNRVQAFGADGAYAGQFGSNGTGDGGLMLPAGVSSNGTHAFVADALNARAEVFSAADWSHAGRVDGDGLGGRLGMPTGVEANSTHLLVSDSANYSVAILRHDGRPEDGFASRLDDAETSALLYESSRILDAHLARYGLNGSGLALSYRAAIAPDGSIALADFGGPYIWTFAPDDTRITITPRLARTTDRVSDIDVDRLGRIVSSEWTRGLVRIIDGNRTVEEFGGLGSADGEFRGLAGIAVGGTGRIYAADAGNDRVQMFDLDWEAPVVHSVRARLPDGAPVDPVANASTASAAAPDTVHITVDLTEPVTVDTYGGTPVLDLETGADAEGYADGSAAYLSGSGTAALTFEYDVDARDSTGRLAYKSAASLRPNGASIIDGSGNPANLTLAGPGGPGSLSHGSHVEIMPGAMPHGPAAGPDLDALYVRCLLHHLLCMH